MASGTSVAHRVEAHRAELTPAERRLADVVLSRPDDVAFGTVAALARRAETSGATVVRFASKLGYMGFSELQDDVRIELTSRLHRAADRIREPAAGDVLGRALKVETTNVEVSIDAIDRDAFERAVTRLSRRDRAVFVLSGDVSRGVGQIVTDELSAARSGVTLLTGTEVGVARGLVDLDPSDTVLVIDLRRYERWLLRLVALAKAQGAAVVAITDGAMSPLADLADEVFVVRAEGAGPFDSLVGTLAVANALVAGAVTRLRATATGRLDRIEELWRQSDALTDG